MPRPTRPADGARKPAWVQYADDLEAHIAKLRRRADDSDEAHNLKGHFEQLKRILHKRKKR